MWVATYARTLIHWLLVPSSQQQHSEPYRGVERKERSLAEKELERIEVKSIHV